MLAFALGSIAHVTHRHDAPLANALHSVGCGYCATFDHMSTPPTAAAVFITPATPTAFVATLATTVATPFAYTSAQPRAPPVS